MADRRYDGEPREQKGSLIGDTLKAGAVLTGGAVVYRNRAAIGRAVSETATQGAITGSRVLKKDGMAYSALQEARMFGKGISDALGDNPSVIRTANAAFNNDRATQMQKSFEASVRKSIQDRHNKRTLPGENKNEATSWFHRDHYKEKPNGLSVTNFEATKAFRINKINEELAEKTAVQKQGGDRILQALNHYTRENESFLNKPEDHIDDFMKKITDGTYKQKASFADDTEKDFFQKEVLGTLQKYTSVKETFTANQSAIVKRAEAFEAGSLFGQLKQQAESETIMSQQLKKGDFSRLTLKNAEQYDIEKKRELGLIIDDVEGKKKPVDITVELRKHLEKSKSNGQLQSLLKERGMEFKPDDFIIDRNIYRNERTGEIIDNRHLKEGVGNGIDAYNESVKIPFLNINFVDLTPWQALRSGKTKEGLQVLHAGQVQGYVRNIGKEVHGDAAEAKQGNAIRGGFKNSDHFYSGGNVFKYNDQNGLEVVDEDLYLVPSQFGPSSRMHENQTHYSRREEADERGWLKKLFDLGHQEGESRYETYKKAWGKLKDPKYGPNAMRSLVYDLNVEQTGHTGMIEDTYNILRVGMDRKAESLSREAAEALSPRMNELFKEAGVTVGGEAFDFSRLADDDYVREAAVALNSQLKDTKGNVGLYSSYQRSVFDEETGGRSTKLYKDPAVRELQRWTEKYVQDPETFIKSRQAAVDRSLPIDISFMTDALGESDLLITHTEKLRRSVHQYAMRALDFEEGDFTKELVQKGVRKRTSIEILKQSEQMGHIGAEDVKNARDLELLTDMLGYDDIHSARAKGAEARTFLQDIFNGGGQAAYYDETGIVFEGGSPSYTAFGAELQEGILRAQPKLGRAPEEGKDALNNADFIVMRKSGLGKAGREAVSSLNLKKIGEYGPIEDYWDLGINTELYLKDTSKTLLEQSTNVVKEMFAGRRKNGDNLEDVTTATGIMYGLAERVNNQMNNLGLGLSQKHLGSFQSILGNQYGRRIALPIMAYQQAVYFDGLTGDTVSDAMADTYVGTHQTIQQIKEVTGINKAMRPWAEVFRSAGFDQVGEWMGVKQADFLTFGMFSDFRSTEDLEHYYESGEDAVRKNRYWGIGSPSPWAGGGIDHFQPNWYRKAKSDYKFTDTMYGSESEYFSNHWMPTLTNPLAPIKHFITDPYHYEEKHKEDRPYAITGGFSSIQNIPIIGPTVDGTIGRILKPRKEHEGLEKAHLEYIAELNEKTKEQYSPFNDGSFVTISGTGKVDIMNKYANQGTGEYFGGTAPTYGVNAGVVDYGTAFGSNTPNANAASGGYGGFVGNPGGMGTGIARDILSAQNYQLALEGDGQSASTVYNLFKQQNSMLPATLDGVGQVDDLRGILTDGFYSASELAGIYGFMTKTTTGYDESWRGTTLAPSNLMTSPSRAFWDMNLGGAGGSLSEIGRRYAPRDPNNAYYSPIRNTMPDWLPGIGEPVDLLHGDPYVKLQKGEMRLPGQAYERLYKLHPDGTGAGDFENYGVFDRFRILGDVSPDSEQYKVAKHQVSLLRQSGGMSEDMEREYDEIIEQVKAKQDTYRWYDKKFSNAKIQKKSVTITKVLDQNTFMVDEYDAPIKLAGVKLTKKDNQDVIDWMGQYIKQGETIEIGIADDPAARFNNDTYGTMSAVVYTQKNEEGRFWFETTKGTSLNSMIANRTWQNKVQIKDDGSPTSTAALYGEDMLTVGKYMETLTHDVLPKVPFVGILADKFLQVRTPIESYKRDQVYGTDWRPWTHPYEAWIKPMVNTVASQNPVIAGAEMAAIGHLFGKTKKTRGIGRVIGAAVGAGTSSLRVLSETGSSLIPGDLPDTWIPEERRTEREINQYFDRLKYVKYRGLYEKASQLAKQEEGIDLDQLYGTIEQKANDNKGLKRYLQDRKKTLSFAKKMGYGDAESIERQLDDFNFGLEQISGAKEAYEAGKYTTLAMKYKQEFEGTLYAMGEFGASDRTALMRALTPKEREYIPRFMESTSSKERQQILKYVPEDIKRILKGSWGLKNDKPEDIKAYFKDHYLPNETWEGWDASTNLDDIKIKVMQKEGINPTVSGYWGKDQARADQNDAKAIPMNSFSHRVDADRLRSIISGLGLSDVDVQLTTSYGNGPGGIDTSINIVKDVKNDILDVLNEQRASIF